jgi:hypothetical protein
VEVEIDLRNADEEKPGIALYVCATRRSGFVGVCQGSMMCVTEGKTGVGGFVSSGINSLSSGSSMLGSGMVVVLGGRIVDSVYPGDVELEPGSGGLIAPR